MNCEGAELYTTTCPCFDCAKLIIQAGISKVYYCEDYRDMSGVKLIERAGIEIEQVISWNAE
jgi:dCMP deaminase